MGAGVPGDSLLSGTGSFGAYWDCPQHTCLHVVLHQGGQRVVGDWLPTKLVFQETQVKLHDFLQPYL
jgi:hypothetical protein